MYESIFNQFYFNIILRRYILSNFRRPVTSCRLEMTHLFKKKKALLEEAIILGMLSGSNATVFSEFRVSMCFCLQRFAMHNEVFFAVRQGQIVSKRSQ